MKYGDRIYIADKGKFTLKEYESDWIL
jgi:hypothetical protein